MKNNLVIALTLVGLFWIFGIAAASEVTGNLNTGISTPGVVGTVIAAPTANPAGGTYTSAQSVVLSAAGSDSIHYSLNGEVPSCSTGLNYAAPISITATTTIKAISCYPLNHTSSVAAFAYTIQAAQTSGGGGGSGGSGQNYPLPQLENGRVLGLTTDNHHPNGTLILDGQTIFLIKAGSKAGFRTPEEYFSHGYSFNQAVPANDADRALTEGPVIKALEGTLVIDGADGRTVYMVGLNGTKRGFTSEQAFTKLGYSFNGLLTINLSDYPAGDNITEESSVHPDGALILDGQTVWWLRGNQRMGFESEQVFKTYGFGFGRVVPATSDDLKLTEGTKVKFRDGTLVRDGGKTYVISDGKRILFESEGALTTRGYKPENAITGGVSGYEDGGTLN